MKMPVTIRVFVFFSLLALLLASCGYKTLPVAPQAVVPRPIHDLQYQLSEKGVTLYWTYPNKTAGDDGIDEIDSFLLYRAVVPADSYCETCPIPFGGPITLPGGILPEKGNKTGSYESPLLKPGNMYFFKIRSKTGWMAESEDSNLISFVWQNPPAPPTGLTVEAKDGAIFLHWQKVTAHLDGTPMNRPVKYQVSRRLDGAAFANIGEPLSSTSYVDRQVENGRKYAYRVQALAVDKKGMTGGGFSENVAANFADKTAPRPPANVKTARTTSSIKIFWDQSTEQDLAGYRVYRRVGTETAPQLVGEVMKPYNLYEDKNPPVKGSKVFYSVSSFDQSSPPNESQRSAEASLR